MTILGRGDLAPPRRYRRRRGRRLLAVFVVVVLAGGGYAAWTQLRGTAKPARRAAPACHQPTPQPASAPVGQVRVRVLNSTQRQRLAHGVAAQLRRRGVHPTGVGNARPQLARTTIRYAAADVGAAKALAEQLPQAVLEEQPSGRLTLVIGRDFTGLATPQQVASARARDLAAASPSPSPCPRP